MDGQRRRTATTALAGAAALVLASAGSAFATDGVPGTMLVTATVAQSAAVVATPLSFGTVAAALPGGSANAATSTITVTATPGTTYWVGINKGTGTGASIATRKLTGNGTTLDYSVYKDDAHTSVWGDTGTDRVSATASTLLDGVKQFTAYGLIAAGQNPANGAYTDTLTVSVTY